MSNNWTLFEGVPYFLRETKRGSNQFMVVKSVKPTTTGKTWETVYDNDIGILTIDKDIEVLYVGQALYLEHQGVESVDMDLASVIQACRIYAQDRGVKYVSALDPCKASGFQRKWAIGVRPRLFKDIEKSER